MSKPTEINQFLNDMDGGVFSERIGRILSEVAAGVMDNAKAGKVVLTFDIKRVEGTYQVAIDHDISYKRPTAHGAIQESNKTKTLMHVDVGGEMTLFPKSQVPKGQQHIADKETGEIVHGKIGETK